MFRPGPRQGHKYTNIKCLGMTVLLCDKQHVNNI